MNDHDDYIEALKMAMSSPMKFNDISTSARNSIFGANSTYGTNQVNSWSSHNITATSQPMMTSHAIQGKMLCAEDHFQEDDFSYISDYEIKMKMVKLIANELFASRCVEFTKKIDPLTGVTTIRARVFVTSDANVQILRKAGY